MEERFFAAIIKCFFISFGVLAGGALFGSLSAYITGDPPISELLITAKKLRIWAIVAAIGGTFDAISTFEKGILDASSVELIKQITLIIAAMGGVKAAIILISWITRGEIT
ncbi:sporulation protein [Halalkalibacillus sediminis]|uniref:Sporulation protein n=1 Tax=Halalkalibacillus sediminis TaxID=2018042 RepID=A0A2I0QY62_9BACI|nr:YtrH family sporulation protein [Halalkalibacillus sediminis]PKR79276.1 sporulation protein [Halalkalibacillus sediminis]